VSCDVGGSFRFWLTPYWSSASALNGSSPGATASLLELDAVSGGQSALAWSLQISADGNTLGLFAETGSGLQEVLQTPIAWMAGQPHCLALVDDPSCATLYVDGSMVAQGSGLPSIPLSAGQLVIGSTLAGTNAAGADIDEFCSFNRLLTAFDVGMYYQWYSGLAALGPYSPQPPRLQRNLAPSGAFTTIYDPDNATPCSLGGPCYITNFSTMLQTNGTTAVSFNIQGGTNGVFADLYYTTNLQNTFAASDVSWLCQVLPCSRYVFSNQPPNAAFYLLPPFQLTQVVAWGDDTDGECDVPGAVSNAIAIAAGGQFSLALLNNGTVIGWGDDTYGQTDIPAGLSNVTAIAAGQFQGVALLANGAVTNWGSYSDVLEAEPDTEPVFWSVTNADLTTLPPTSNVVAIAAGLMQGLALLSDGTCAAWGVIGAYGTHVPTGLTNVAAIACGEGFNLALLSNGTLKAWGDGGTSTGWDFTNYPPGLSNIVAIASGEEHGMALLSNGTVVAWGYNPSGETNVPSGLSNVVAVAAGGNQSLALQADGTVVAWGAASLTNIPAGLKGVKAICAGYDHSLAIYSDQLFPLILAQPSNTFCFPDGTFAFQTQAVGLGTLQYQWQFDGFDIFGATNSSLTITNAQGTNQGTYDVVIASPFGFVTSSIAVFAIAQPPRITNTTPAAPSTNWITSAITLSVGATAIGQQDYPLSYQWQLNGTNIPAATNASYTISTLTPTNDGNYTVVVTNALGGTNVTWDILWAVPGMVDVWGDNTNEQCDPPAPLPNVAGIAAGEFQSIAVTDSGTVVQWGEYTDGIGTCPVTDTNYTSQPPTSGVVAVAAGWGHALALMTNGAVVAWGLYGNEGTQVPPNLAGAKAIACGFDFSVALLTNGTVRAWGVDYLDLTNVPSGLTNVTAIAAGMWHTLAISNGTVVAWGYDWSGDTLVPSGLTNVVAVAAGMDFSLALTSSGQVVAWGDNSSGQCEVSGMSNVMAIAAGDEHGLALINDGTLVAWGDNTFGQTNLPFASTNYPVKLIAAGGFHSMAALWSPLVQYPVDPSKDLLLIYNTNSLDSSNVCQYYLAHRPMVGNAMVFGINVTTNDPISPSDFTTNFQPQVQTWLSNNPTLRPQYVVLFQNVPQEVDTLTNGPADDWGQGTDAHSVQYQLHSSTAPGWSPFVTAINMNGTSGTIDWNVSTGTNFHSSDGTNDCVAYIDKLVNMASNNPPGTLFISATAAGYDNTNWYFEGTWNLQFAASGAAGVTNVDPLASVYVDDSLITAETNVAGYLTAGWDGGHTNDYAITNVANGGVQLSGNSGWYIMTSVDSYCGQRVTFQSSYLTWFASNSFGGTNYSNTPIGATTTVNEPGSPGTNPEIYYGEWAAGKSFAISAWAGMHSVFEQAVGDPFTRK
jgi:alpha-tubulin suppressor-like RCC1 family protein